MKQKRGQAMTLLSVHRALSLLLASAKKPQIKPLWPQQFPVSQLSFGSHQDWIFCTRNQILVSKTSCTAGIHLLMGLSLLLLGAGYWGKKRRISWESDPTKEMLERISKGECGECDSYVENLIWRTTTKADSTEVLVSSSHKKTGPGKSHPDSN